MIKRVEGGFQIASHTDPDKVYPKIYPTKQAAEKRVEEMMRHAKKPDSNEKKKD
jgi:hypothetical protein